MAFSWTTTTTPFTDGHGREPARFVLEQVDDTWFHLVEPFRYRRRDGSTIPVDHEHLGPTDLASIQPAVAWFVTRHGRHTPAALVHDQLTTGSDGFGGRVDADRVFRDAMEDLGVPPVRAWVMWSAVAAATRWDGGGQRRAALVVWGAASLVGTGVLAHGVAGMCRDRLAACRARCRRGGAHGDGAVRPAPGPQEARRIRRRRVRVALALAAPAPAAVLWGAQWRAGLIAGYAAWVVLVPTATSAGGYGLYWVAEELLRAGRQVLAGRGAPEPPGPVPFAETT